MNRRDLMKRGAEALLGIGGVVLGVKAAPPALAADSAAFIKKEALRIATSVNDQRFGKAVVGYIVDDIRAGGPVREAIQREAQRGL